MCARAIVCRGMVGRMYMCVSVYETPRVCVRSRPCVSTELCRGHCLLPGDVVMVVHEVQGCDALVSLRQLLCLWRLAWE